MDKFFSREFQIHKASDMPTQRLGIDRIFIRYSDGSRYSVEYKGDDRTADTGNVFIETVSVDTENKPGWAYTSVAQWIIYFIPQWKRACIAYTTTIRKYLPEWKEKYREQPVQNDGYITKGLLVPFEVFRKICKVVEVDDGSAA